VSCPRCDRAASYHADRRRTVVSLFGTIRYHRAYYYCRQCGQGICPFDEQAAITQRQLTPAVEQLTTLAGAVAESFERGAELLGEMAGVPLSEATVTRTTEDAGHRLAALHEQGTTVGPAVQWNWYSDDQGQSVAYISIDATGTRQQAPGGGAAEGRMAYVAAVYNPVPEHRPTQEGGRPPPQMQARYISGLYCLAEMGPLLRRQAARVGMDKAQLWVALTDGGSGLEDFVCDNFHREDLVVILDYYHAASYLEKLARALHPADEAAAQGQAEQWCRLLKAEGGATTLAVLREWDWPTRRSSALREQWEAVESYFSNNVHRMEYPEYQAAGWQIGSGVVESACKTVVGQRLKGAGMRWSESGAHALCHVRALYRSEKGQWQAFWKRQFTNKANGQQLM
jgi:hypothetical protein